MAGRGGPHRIADQVGFFVGFGQRDAVTEPAADRACAGPDARREDQWRIEVERWPELLHVSGQDAEDRQEPSGGAWLRISVAGAH